MSDEGNLGRDLSLHARTATPELQSLGSGAGDPIEDGSAFAGRESILQPWAGVRRIASFLAVVIILVFAMNLMITTGLRRIKTSAFGALNQIMDGKVNSQIVVTGSSRALAHYDPRILQAITGRTAYNLGRNGSQTDMQVAFLKAYLEHNRRPEVVIQNLDAFTFVTSREVYDQVEYQPYLNDPALYDALHEINPNIWKSRYLPLYGYVVEDMKFSWVLGIGGFLGWSPREDYFQGFNPRTQKWSEEFKQFKASNPHGVSFDIEPAGVQVVEELIRVCKEENIKLIFVYSPEYSEMQPLTRDRSEIFAKFHELADRSNIPLWDYSSWTHASDQEFFQNSQHLNSAGAAVFSDDVAQRLRTFLTSHSMTGRIAQLQEPVARFDANRKSNYRPAASAR